MGILDNKYLLIGAAAAGVAIVFMAKKAATAAITEIPKLAAQATQAVNPLNDNNVINQGATALYQGITGSTGSIGGDIYDATHGGALDVTSSNNVAASTVDNLGASVSGNPHWTLGGAIYDWTH